MLIFKKPSEMEFRQVMRMVEKFDLAPTDLPPDSFTILKNDERILGFGAMRANDGYTELELLGVAEEYRGKGWGKLIVKKLLEHGPDTVWLATDMPKYFEKFDFVSSKQIPRELSKKINPSEVFIPGQPKPAPPPKNRLKAMVFMRKK